MAVSLRQARRFSQSVQSEVPQAFTAPSETFGAACFERGRDSLPACPAGLLGRQASGTTGLALLEAGLASSSFFTLAGATVSGVLTLLQPLLPGRVGEEEEEEDEEEVEREPCCCWPDLLVFFACLRRTWRCCCCLIDVGERTTGDGSGGAGVGVELLVTVLFAGACTDAINPLFPDAKSARVGRFFEADEFLACWRCWCLVCFAAAASLACPPPRVNFTGGTSIDGTTALLRRACAMWYSFDSPAGTKILRGGEGEGDGVGSWILVTTAAAGAGRFGVGFPSCSFGSWAKVVVKEDEDGGQEERKAGKISQVGSAGLKSIRSLPVKEGLRILLVLMARCGVTAVGRTAVDFSLKGGNVTVFAD